MRRFNEINTLFTMSENTKDTIGTIIRIILIVLAIIFLAWLAVMIVRAIPSAFNTLVGITEELYETQPADTLTVTQEENVVNSGETVDIAWSDLGRAGTYTFSYNCTDGATVEIKDENGAIVPVACGDELTLSEDVNELTLFVTSTQDRFVDLAYQITFTPENERRYDQERAEDTLTIVNPRIPLRGLADTDTVTDSTQGRNDTTRGSVTAPLPYTGATAEDQEEVRVPADLIVALPTVPTLTSGLNTITVRVTNTGTLQSETWHLVLTLPSGETFATPHQPALLGDQRADVKIEFVPKVEAGTYTMNATVVTDDQKEYNNSTTIDVVVRD